MMRRVLQLWRVHGAMDLRWMLRDVRAVVSFTVSDLIVSVASVMGVLLLAARFNHFGRWTPDQVVFMVGYGSLVTGLPGILFNYNVAFISRRIGRGQLDHTLLQPQPIWMSLLTEGFAPFSAAMQLAPALALLCWALPRAGVAVTPGWLALLALNVISSATVVLAYTYLVGSLAFWAPRAAEEINSQSWQLIAGLKQFPLDGAGPLLAGSLFSVAPIGFMAWAPCRALLSLGAPGWSIAITPLAAVFFSILAVLVFRRGLQVYGRTGSQRYLSFGHRR